MDTNNQQIDEGFAKNASQAAIVLSIITGNVIGTSYFASILNNKNFKHTNISQSTKDRELDHLSNFKNFFKKYSRFSTMDGFDYDKLFKIIHYIESTNSTNKNMSKEDAYTSLGPFQITKSLLDDVNRINKLSNKPLFKYSDRMSLEKSKEIAKTYFDYYVKQYNVPLTYINLLRMWNGGPKAFKKQDENKERALNRYVSKAQKFTNIN